MIAAVAVLPALNGRKVLVVDEGKLHLILIGKKVSSRKLLRVLKPYGGDFLMSADALRTGFMPYDTKEYRQCLLFRCFCEYVLSVRGRHLKVGVVDHEGRFFTGLIPVIAHAEAVTVLCDADADEFCTDCIKQTGTCPDIVYSESALGDCEVVFAPDGITIPCEILFGKGGYLPSSSDFPLPDCCAAVVKLGVDAIDLAALLSADEPSLSAGNVIPKYLSSDKGTISFDDLCGRRFETAIIK